ncbi:MAG: S1-like domain-containing RNA-binding protein [Actinobacteria bacterium]|nr:S1-like domain-containing RNA-binding protein [Actinomycetota bacterium]
MVGKYQKMKIAKIRPSGVYLEAGEGSAGNNVLLPAGQLPEGAKEGDDLEVFIYRDSQDHLAATVKKPAALLGELACLKVAETTGAGAYLDWGLDFDLFLPLSEQKYRVQAGKSYLVAVALGRSGRLIATTDIYKYLQPTDSYKKNDQVTGTVYAIRRDIGVLVAVDNQFYGLIPESEQYRDIKPGEKVEVRITRVREDGKLDLSPRKLSHEQMEGDAGLILEKIKEKGGSLPLNDRSSPTDIKMQLNMSKSAFKRAVGRLLKENKIEQSEESLVLRDPVVPGP